jgi:hypothetical protein
MLLPPSSDRKDGNPQVNAELIIRRVFCHGWDSPSLRAMPSPRIPHFPSGFRIGRAASAPKLMRDYAPLARHRGADSALMPAAAGEHRVVFIGDSITDNSGVCRNSSQARPMLIRASDGKTPPSSRCDFARSDRSASTSGRDPGRDKRHAAIAIGLEAVAKNGLSQKGT